MKTIIFGGRHGYMLQDYLYHLRRAISVQLEKQIESGASEKEAKQKVKRMFTLEKMDFDISEGIVSDTHDDRYENIPVPGGGTRRAFMKKYSYSILFKGESKVLKYRPETFHGVDREADVSGNYSSEQNTLTVEFSSEVNNKAEFEKFKKDCIGELDLNCTEINKEITVWNKTQLDQAIEALYPIALSEVNQYKTRGR